MDQVNKIKDLIYEAEKVDLAWDGTLNWIKQRFLR